MLRTNKGSRRGCRLFSYSYKDQILNLVQDDMM